MIRRQIVVPVDPDRLWWALTDPAGLAGWFGGTVEWELREGAGLTYRGDDGDRREGRIESVRPGRHLRFRWWPADGDEPTAGIDPDDGGAPVGVAGGTHRGPGEPGAAAATEVSYVLVPDGDGTRLTVQERPLEGRSAAGTDRSPSASASAGSGTGGAAGWTEWDERLALGWIGLDPGVRATVGARS